MNMSNNNISEKPLKETQFETIKFKDSFPMESELLNDLKEILILEGFATYLAILEDIFTPPFGNLQ